MEKEDVNNIVDRANNVDSNTKKRQREEPPAEEFDEVDTPTEEQTLWIPNKTEQEERFLIEAKLKPLIAKYPDIDTSRTERIDLELAQLSTEELKKKLQNIQLEIGLLAPNQQAKATVGLASRMIENLYGKRGLYDRLMADDELLTCIQSYLPLEQDWMTVPMVIGHRLAGHVSDMHYSQNNFGPPIPPSNGNSTTTSQGRSESHPPG